MSGHKSQKTGVLIVRMGGNVEHRAIKTQTPDFLPDLITRPARTVAKPTLG
jgi:hypothetical protein